MTSLALTLDPASVAGYVVMLVALAWACVRVPVLQVEGVRVRLDIGCILLETDQADRRIATLSRRYTVAKLFRHVLGSRRTAGVERARILPDLDARRRDGETRRAALDALGTSRADDTALPEPTHRLTGSLDRNAPPAARMGAYATEAYGTATRADRRRREHSAAP